MGPAEDVNPGEKVKYYLYAESMMDEDGIPIEEHMEVYEKDDIRKAAEACIAEIPSWMNPKLEECLEEDDWAVVSISIGGEEALLQICGLDYLEVKDL